MPTSFTAVLIYALLLVPGMAYVREFERKHPTGKQSAFRETSAVVIVSLIMVCAATFLILMVSLTKESIAKSVDRALFDLAGFATQQPRIALFYLLLYLISATLLAILAARNGWWSILERNWSGDGEFVPEAGWGLALNRTPNNEPLSSEITKILSLQTKSGIVIRGQVSSFTPSVDENLERSIVLLAPIYKKEKNGKMTPMIHADKLVIHASEIEFFGIRFINEDGTSAFPELFPDSKGD